MSCTAATCLEESEVALSKKNASEIDQANGPQMGGGKNIHLSTYLFPTPRRRSQKI
jgi:hypothetical protein